MKRFLSIVTVVLCVIHTANAEQIDVGDLSIVAGGSATLEIELSSERTDFVAFQMDVTLPEGVGIDKTGCTLSSRIADEEQELVIGVQEPGVYRLTSTSLSLTPFSGTSGVLLTLRLTVAEGSVGGQATIGNIRFSTSGSERVTMEDAAFAISPMYGLTYMVDGVEYKDSTLAYGATITPEDEPTKEGYTFSGWSEIPTTMPANDVVVTGTFTVNTYQVTFMYGDEVLKTDSVEYGAVIPLPESLESDRYTLVEWLDVPETMPAHDLVIYADYTDGIGSIENGRLKIENATVYDLSGRRITRRQKGININILNGRKVVIR